MTAIDTEDLVEDVVGDDHGAASGNADSKSKSGDSDRDSSKARRQMTFSLRTVVVAAVICLLAVAAGVLGWLYADAQGQLDTATRQAGYSERAEGIAADYAVHAAEMDYQDFNAWKVKLVKGTSPELKEKLGKAADSMEQVLTPMQWKSTAKPLATKTRSNAGGVYVVDSFVSVLTKTMQTPEGLQSTATYSITIDSNNNWQITDVGGIDSALGK
ncbi:hypothetical protein [Mycobacteroides franklinii]|uniref:Mce-associated membrane protein n=1 Tax=Mycobacteroides franklinii TaxID=948102 RepID=A0A4R5PCD0_9MYCO|nr:hypothetical protein [Mycobacteroides franklinii]ORA63000.1 hypothetical protein BST24_04990 [Mycobacteroides franklinii]TDH22407.1 hypothetical protein EJ571_10825 [Mycobacteroides franklinii]TDZ44035.1 hypothetical protein CCUG64054_04100 [Mycobacteroides franklinii]TDZ51169.1 hypothetical protein CCUG63697_02685 [Mycobacteroides franklinii]TDZ57589.1 hypothetical protein CCUG63696_04096 [Mycobacteroides franklinii]